MTPPSVILLDRDATLLVGSSNPASPFYYLKSLDYVIVKPGVREALGIIRAHAIPTVLATKQRCVSKGLVTRESLDRMHTHLQRDLGHTFLRVMVEESAETKEALYREIIEWAALDPETIWLFDDSEVERETAARMGIKTFDGANLYAAVTRALDCA